MKNLRKFFKKTFNFFEKLLARVYNLMPDWLKIVFYNVSSIAIGSLGAKLVADITDFKNNVNNEYLAILIVALIPIISSTVNVLQKRWVDSGNFLLAQQGDQNVKKIYTKKADEASKVRNLARANEPS